MLLHLFCDILLGIRSIVEWGRNVLNCIHYLGIFWPLHLADLHETLCDFFHVVGWVESGLNFDFDGLAHAIVSLFKCFKVIFLTPEAAHLSFHVIGVIAESILHLIFSCSVQFVLHLLVCLPEQGCDALTVVSYCFFFLENITVIEQVSFAEVSFYLIPVLVHGERIWSLVSEEVFKLWWLTKPPMSH